MTSSTIIHIEWKISKRKEVFVNLGKLYSFYHDGELGVSRWTLNRKNLYNGYENDIVAIRKYDIKS